jgi:ADP-ribose pyrophosphatase YjhB (NUDIX family)
MIMVGISRRVMALSPTAQPSSEPMEPVWLVWARGLQAIAQTGLTFATNAYDRERYMAIRSLAADMMATQSDADFGRVAALFAEQTGYATPKVDVRGAVFDNDNRILLVREIADSGRWTIPGGWADVNQSPSESVIREVQEEAGLEVKVRKLAAVYDRARHAHAPPHPFHVFKLFFICDVIGGTPKAGLETSEVAFFDENEIPQDLSVGRVLPHQIKRMFDHAKQRDLPTDFD